MQGGHGESDNKALRLVKWLVYVAQNGGPGFKTAEQLADEYIRNPKFRSDEERVDTLIRTQAMWNAGTGFMTSFGGPITLPLAITGSLAASWVIQVRLVQSPESCPTFMPPGACHERST